MHSTWIRIFLIFGLGPELDIVLSSGLGLDIAGLELELASKTQSPNTEQTWPMLAKAKSGLVPVFQRPEKKLGASLGLCDKARSLLVAQSTKGSLSGLVVL